MIIGVLGFQGSVIEHYNSIKKTIAKPLIVKTINELNNCDALIIPGGETTNLRKIIPLNLKKTIMRKAKKGFPIYGTCAGAILLSKKIKNEKSFMPLIDVEIQRNAYGSQLESFEEKIKIIGLKEKFNAIFIRAPIVKKILSKKTQTLASVNNNPVLLKQKNILISTFHPELTNDTRIHELFIKMIQH